MNDIFSDYIWKWNQSIQFYKNDALILDGNRERILFTSRYVDKSMKLAYGDLSLKQDCVHSWTIFIEDLHEAEVIIGISAHSDMSELIDFEDQIQNENIFENLWVISNKGYLRHGKNGAALETWKFYKKDHVTVCVNYPEKKLSFFINGYHMGVEYVNLPEGCLIIPVVGATNLCSLHLKSTHASIYNLELKSLLSLSHFKCNEKTGPVIKTILPKDLKQIFMNPVRLYKYIWQDIPAGLLSMLKMSYPWFFEKNIHRTRHSFVKKIFYKNRNCRTCLPKRIIFALRTIPNLHCCEKLNKKRKIKRTGSALGICTNSTLLRYSKRRVCCLIDK